MERWQQLVDALDGRGVLLAFEFPHVAAADACLERELFLGEPHALAQNLYRVGERKAKLIPADWGPHTVPNSSITGVDTTTLYRYPYSTAPPCAAGMYSFQSAFLTDDLHAFGFERFIDFGIGQGIEQVFDDAPYGVFGLAAAFKPVAAAHLGV